MAMRVGVLGLGRMGLPIATALAGAAFEVTVFDPSPDRAALAAAASLVPAPSALTLANTVDVLVTVLPGAAETGEVMLDDGLVDELMPGSLWLDLTSSAPDVVEQIAGRAAARGVVSVAAPMAGGPSAAESGALRFFAGGTDVAFAIALPLLEILGGDDAVTHVGLSVADGCSAKLLANLLWFGQVVAVTEALLLGVSLGVPIESLRKTLASSAGGSVFIDEYLDSLLSGDYLETFGIDRCVEELETLVRLAQGRGVPFELSTLVARLHREALERFGAIDGELLAAKLLEQRAGVALRDAKMPVQAAG
jgi:3-hydroxyisobutyrate dehydrogenase-like beta-hydroxyacid dehydrogenase